MQQDVQRPSRFGEAGQSSDRNTRGQFTAGNTAAMVIGERSRQFWREHDQVRQHGGERVNVGEGGIESLQHGDRGTALVDYT